MFMRLTKVLTVFAAVLILASPLSAQNCLDNSTGLTFTSSLSGSQFGGQGSPSGLGNSSISIDPNTGVATVTLNTSGLGGTITGAGLNRNGTNGGSSQSVLSFTDADNTFDQDGSLTRTLTLSPTLLNEILANPSNFSIGVNTGEFPDGALSGSLMQAQSYAGTFSGSSVVGDTSGSTNGGGSFTADITPSTSGTGSVLNYSFTPTGIGNNLTGFGLYQGQAGTNGTLFQSLSTGGTLTNGRLTGSIPLTAAQAQQLMTNPSGFYLSASTSQFPNGAIRSQFGTASNEWFLPVAGSVRGRFNTTWQTALQIYNASPSTRATVTVQLLAAGQSNFSGGSMNATNVGTLTVPAGGVSTLNNSLEGLFNLNTGTGALRILSDQPIVVTERIYDAAGGSDGSDAQQIYAMTRCEALTRGVLIGAANANDNGTGLSAATRTSIGFFNPNAVAVTVNLTSTSANGVGNGDGTTTAQTITLQPFQQTQMPLMGTNGLFTTAGFRGGAVTFIASAPIFAYTSTTNNSTGDTHVLMAKEDQSATTAAMSDSDIAAIVTAANQGEVQQGNLAVNRATAPAVRDFAQQMVTQHTIAQAQAQTVFTNAGITPSTNATSTYLTTNSQQTQATLSGMSGNSFDRAYIQSQITMHQMVLATIDQVLLPSAQNAQLRNLLQTMAAEVQSHLTQAQQVLTNL
jgi:putative membrane protein